MDVEFRYAYLPQRFIEEWNTIYSENETVALPLNLSETPKQKHLSQYLYFIFQPTFNYQTHVTGKVLIEWHLKFNCKALPCKGARRNYQIA